MDTTHLWYEKHPQGTTPLSHCFFVSLFALPSFFAQGMKDYSDDSDDSGDGDLGSNLIFL
jgi:hypothetical protein